MADTAVTPNVFVDTEVFDHHSRDLSSANFRVLSRLSSSGEINLVLTTVTEHEIRSHIDGDAKDAFKRLQNYKRMSRAVKRVLPDPKLEPDDEESIRKDLQKEFDEFLESANAEILKIDDVPAGPIFEKYFKQQAPFGDKNKKSEFPDAFAFAALEAWCKSNSSKLYVVSGDSDWKRACKLNPDLIYVERLDQLLEKYGDSVQVTAVKEALSKIRDSVVEHIEETAWALDYFVSDDLLDAELEVTGIKMEVGEFHVVDAKDGKAIVSVSCTLHISADVTAMDPNSMWTDPDSGELRSVWNLRGSVEHEEERDVTMEVSFDANDTDRVGFKNVRFEDKEVQVDVDEHELSCEDFDEDEFEDYDVPEDQDPE